MKDFQSLKVWRKSHQLTLEVYKLTRSFPKDELYGLTSQLRRSAASVGANIAEGCGRGGDAEFARFLQIAMGSASETEYHLLLAHDLNFVSPDDFEKYRSHVIEIKKMLASFINRIKSSR